MKNCILIYLLLICLALLATNVLITEARGGRRGGSFGGIFGGWRKYKKSTSMGGSARRTTNGSPMHTSATKSISSGSLASTKPLKQTKTQSSYTKKQMPINNQAYVSGHGSYYNNAGAVNAPYLPPGAKYYANYAAMPSGATYYAQPPARDSAANDFLFGLMTAHVMNHGLFRQRQHIYVYPQTTTRPQHQGQQDQLDNGKVIIINTNAAGTNAENSTSKLAAAPTQEWPFNEPLAAFNTSITPEKSQRPDIELIAPSLLRNTSEDIQASMPQGHEHHAATAKVEQQQQQQQPPMGPIACVSVWFNEEDPHDRTKTQQVEKVICFPAPTPAVAAASSASAAATASSLPQQQAALPSNTICFKHTIIERDPNDATKTITVEKEDCSIVATTQPPQVAGEIGENIANETTHNTSSSSNSSTADLLQLPTDTGTSTTTTTHA